MTLTIKRAKTRNPIRCAIDPKTKFIIGLPARVPGESITTVVEAVFWGFPREVASNVRSGDELRPKELG
jgi:hypothetical protein